MSLEFQLILAGLVLGITLLEWVRSEFRASTLRFKLTSTLVDLREMAEAEGNRDHPDVERLTEVIEAVICLAPMVTPLGLLGATRYRRDGKRKSKFDLRLAPSKSDPESVRIAKARTILAIAWALFGRITGIPALLLLIAFEGIRSRCVRPRAIVAGMLSDLRQCTNLKPPALPS